MHANFSYTEARRNVFWSVLVVQGITYGKVTREKYIEKSVRLFPKFRNMVSDVLSAFREPLVESN
jgi:hypothetical protein